MEGSMARRMAGAAFAGVALVVVACSEPAVTQAESSQSSAPIATTKLETTLKPPVENLKVSTFSLGVTGVTEKDREKQMAGLQDKEVDMEIDREGWIIKASDERPISDKHSYLDFVSTIKGPKGFHVLVTKGQLDELIKTGFYGLEQNSTPETALPAPIPLHKHFSFFDSLFEGKPTFELLVDKSFNLKSKTN